MDTPDLTNQNAVNLHIIQALGDIKVDISSMKAFQDVYIADTKILKSKVDGLEKTQRYYAGFVGGIGVTVGIVAKHALGYLGIHLK